MVIRHLISGTVCQLWNCHLHTHFLNNGLDCTVKKWVTRMFIAKQTCFDMYSVMEVFAWTACSNLSFHVLMSDICLFFCIIDRPVFWPALQLFWDVQASLPLPEWLHYFSSKLQTYTWGGPKPGPVWTAGVWALPQKQKSTETTKYIHREPLVIWFLLDWQFSEVLCDFTVYIDMSVRWFYCLKLELKVHVWRGTLRSIFGNEKHCHCIYIRWAVLGIRHILEAQSVWYLRHIRHSSETL